MTSIYQRAMGQDFERLHPEIRKRFGFCSADNIAAIGRGVMEEVWHGPPWTLPFLWFGAWRRIMFPERGKDVPFKIENWAYIDSLGRETVTWLRTFEIRRPPRLFDAYMVYSEGRGKIIDYMGTHQRLAVDIDLSVSESGGLQLRSSGQRFYAGPIGFRFPLLFSGVASVCEWFRRGNRSLPDRRVGDERNLGAVVRLSGRVRRRVDSDSRGWCSGGRKAEAGGEEGLMAA